MMSKEKRRVPKLRFPGFTEDWEQRKLGDVANIKTGSRNQQDSVINGKYPFFIRSEKIEKLDTYDFDTEAILVPGDGRIGEIFHYYNGKFALHQRVYKVDDFKGVDAFYLLYLFQCKFKEHALRLNAQGTVPSLRLPMFTEWNISMPSLKEQICIGRLLNKIELMITLHQRKLDNLKLKKKALLQKLFPKNGERYPELRFPGFTDAWEQRKLIYIFNDFIVPMRDKPKVFSGTTPWTRIEDIEGRYINTSLSSQFVSDETIKSMNLKVIPKGSLIVSASATFGVVAIVNNDLITNQTFIGLVPNKDFDIDFLYSLFETPATKGKLLKLSAGSTIFYIARESFENLVLSVPSKEEQIKISKVFKSIDDTITLHQRKLDHLKLQKKALLQQMFV